MLWNGYIGEKIFLLIILLYLVFLYRYRRRIGSSKITLNMLWQMEIIGKSVRSWYYNLSLKRTIVTLIVTALLVISGYEAYARLNPKKRFTRLVDRCEDLVKEKKHDQAIIDMTNALKIRPDYVRGYYFLAFLHREKGDPDKALRIL